MINYSLSVIFYHFRLSFCQFWYVQRRRKTFLRNFNGVSAAA